MSRRRKKQRCVECKRTYGRRTKRRLGGRYCSSVCRDVAQVRHGLEEVDRLERERGTNRGLLNKASMAIDDIVKDSGMLNKKQAEAFMQMLLKPAILPKNLVVGRRPRPHPRCATGHGGDR